MENMKHLLVLSCGSAKINRGYPHPAWEVYDGPVYRAVRKRVLNPQGEVEIWILSAKFGLIPGWQEIEWYEQQMTFARALQLWAPVTAKLKTMLASGEYVDAFENLGSTYQIAAADGFRDSPIPVERASGGIGVRMGMTVKWLDRLL